MLIESDMPSGQQDRLRTIESSALGLLELISQILDHAKIEAKRIQLEMRTFNVRSYLERVIDVFSGELERRK